MIAQHRTSRRPPVSRNQTMPIVPSEPEKYSIDEMMERLKAKPPDNGASGDQGELVTRADGTQAVRLRKRKRRSKQPAKELEKKKARGRTIQVTLALVILIVVGLTAGGLILYANTPGYRASLIKKAGAKTGAEVTLQEFRVTPLGARARSARFVWPVGSVIQSVELRGLAAETHLSSLFGRSWSGEEITANEGHLVLRSPTADEPRRTTEPAIPPTIEFHRIGVPNLRISLEGGAGNLIDIRGTEASFYPKGANGRSQLQLNRGIVRIAGWPELRLDRSFMEFQADEVNIVSLRLLDSIDQQGFLLLAGSVMPHISNQRSALTVQLEAFPLAGLIGEEFASLVSARVKSRETTNANLLSFAPGNAGSEELAVAFETAVTELRLAYFPFLTTLARRLQDPWFETPPFETATGKIRRNSDSIELDLDLQRRARMAVRGTVTIGPGLALGGTLDIGLAEAVVEASPDRAIAELFSRDDDGYRWATVNLAGTATVPTDDLQSRLSGTSGRAPGASNEAPAEPSFEDLTRPR